MDLADQVSALGPVDAVIHNAGVGYGGSPRPTADGFPDIFAVNVLAPYILTARISGARRLVYLSSSMHRVSPNLHDILWRTRRWNGSLAVSAASSARPFGAFLWVALCKTAKGCETCIDRLKVIEIACAIHRCNSSTPLQCDLSVLMMSRNHFAGGQPRRAR